MKLRTQVTLYYGLLILLSIGLSSALYRRINRELADRKLRELAMQTLYTIQSGAQALFDNTNRYSHRIIASSAVQAALAEDPSDRGSALSNRAILKTVNEILLAEQTVSSIYIFRNDDVFFSLDDMRSGMGIDSVRRASWYEEAVEGDGGQVWMVNAGGALNRRTNEEEYVSLVRTINDLYAFRMRGMLLINIPVSAIMSSFPRAVGEDRVELSIRRNGRTLIPFPEEKLRIYADSAGFWGRVPGVFSGKLSGDEYLFASTESRGWEYCIAFRVDDRADPYAPVSRVLLPIAAVRFLLIFLGSLWISRSVTRPLLVLLKEMKRVEEGEFRQARLSGRSEEIHQLQDRYNSMIATIERSILHEKEEQRTRRKLELDILHEQIKPHFLYNSLESAGYLALTGEREKSYRLITALASYYQQSLSKGDEVIPLRQEFDVTRHYLTIENMRYPDLFSVSYDLDPSLADCLIPKLTLQPLVENALQHGIRPTGQPGIVKIAASPEEGCVRLTVEDNGAGMVEERLKTIIDGKLEANPKSFGLRGTIARLRLFFGEDFTYSVLSWPGEGTVISVSFPMLRSGPQSDCGS